MITERTAATVSFDFGPIKTKMLFSFFFPLCDGFTVEDPKDSQRMDAIGQIGVPFKVLAHIPGSYGLKDNFAHPDYKQTSRFGVRPVEICAYIHRWYHSSTKRSQLHWVVLDLPLKLQMM